MLLSAGSHSPSALQLDVEGRERLHADQVVHNTGRVGIVSAVMELVNHARGILKALIPEGPKPRQNGKKNSSWHPTFLLEEQKALCACKGVVRFGSLLLPAISCLAARAARPLKVMGWGGGLEGCRGEGTEPSKPAHTNLYGQKCLLILQKEFMNPHPCLKLKPVSFSPRAVIEKVHVCKILAQTDQRSEFNRGSFMLTLSTFAIFSEV